MKFQEKVWELMKRIPRGKVTTYSIIAKKLNTKAYRAVGNACHNNPYAPMVPCHRVVNSNGKVGGFASGGKNKIKLLKKEGIKIKGDKVLDFEKVLYYLD
jgi:methylated-DNA-[protein]-cysteine S-methyltransferase